MTTPAGWYPDATDPDRQRWWDGQQWTEHTRPLNRQSAQTASATQPSRWTARGVNGQVTFDGDFVTINRKGGFARMTIGKGDKRIPLASISAVQYKPPGPLVNGFIAFTVPGGNEGRSKFGSQTIDAAKDENAVIVRKSQDKEFQDLRAAVEAAIVAHHKPQAATVVHAAPDLAEQLTKLAALRDQGILTNEEFDAKKADLLSRM